MDRKKQMDIIRKRNSELSQQLDDLKFKLEYDSQLNEEGYKHAKDLIKDLEEIKAEWLDTLEEIEGYKIRYSFLIDELEYIKSLMIDLDINYPWYKRLWFKISRKVKVIL